MVRSLALATVTVLVLIGGVQAEARADDSFRCGTRLVQLGDLSGAVKAACGQPTDIRTTKGSVQNGDGTRMTIEFETWTYDLGPLTFARILVLADGVLTSITTGDYGR